MIVVMICLQIEMSQAVARAALLFTGRGVTINHLKEYGPTWLSGVSQDEVSKLQCSYQTWDCRGGGGFITWES